MQILKENELKSPFDLREMTWYIIPGVTLILMIFLFELWMATEIKEIKIFSKEKNSSDSTSINSKELKILENNSLKDSILKSAEINTIEKLKSTISQKELDSLLLDTKSKIIKEKISLLHTPVFTALLITHTGDNIFSNSWVLSALYLLLLLSICYLLGHVLYMVGTFIYERGLVSKGHNYPYIRLLQLKEHETKTEIEINSSKGFYKGIAFWITFFFVGYYVLKYSTDWSPIFFNSYVIITLICFILIPIRIKFILATLNEWEKFYDTAILARDNALKKKKEVGKEKIVGQVTNEPLLDIFVKMSDKKILKTTEKMISFKNWMYWLLCSLIVCIVLFLMEIVTASNFVFLFIFIFLLFVGTEWIGRKIINSKNFPLNLIVRLLKTSSKYKNFTFQPKGKYDREKMFYDIIFMRFYYLIGNELDTFTKNYFSMQEKFDENFIVKYKENFKKVFNRDYNDLNRHNYWLAKFFIMENSPYLNTHMNFWENTYRFTKSLSAAFLIAFIYCGLSFMLQIPDLIPFMKSIPALFNHYKYPLWVLFLIPLVFHFLNWICVVYYLYVYDNRYNRIVLRSFVSLVDSKEYNKKIAQEINLSNAHNQIME